LASSCGSVENLKLSARQGCSPHSRHTLATFTFDKPSSAASSRLDQCVTPSRADGGSSVASTTATSSMVRGLPGLGRSSSPPMPSAAYRRFQKITVGLDTPVRAMISLVPSPSPASNTIRARRAAQRNLHGHSQRHKPSSANENQTSRYLAHGTLGHLMIGCHSGSG